MRLSRLSLAAVPLALVLAACGTSSVQSTGVGVPATSSPATSSPATSSTLAPSTAAAQCDYPTDGRKPAKAVGTPSTSTLLAPKTLTLSLTVGSAQKDVVIALKPATAPCTVNAISYLASKGYYDGTTCHRLTTPASGISVLQCGDPTGTGGGTPGFSFDDELSGSETYPAGTVAMANAGPNTNGSQFFLVYGDTPLPANYTVFGTITSGLDAVQQIGAAGTAEGAPDGHPKQPVTISRATTS